MILNEARDVFQKPIFGFRGGAAYWTPRGRGEDNVFTRRAFGRATLAFVESSTFAMQQLALATHEEGEVRLDDSDLAILAMKAYGLDDEGKPHQGR